MKPSKSKHKKAAPAKTTLSKALAKAVPAAKAPAVKAPVVVKAPAPAAKIKPLVLVKKAPVKVVKAKAKANGLPRSARNDENKARNDENKARNDAKATTKSKVVAKPRVAKPTPNKLRIFQIHYQPGQVAQLDPAFEAYDNTDDASPLLEFNVFRKLQQSGLVKGADLWGALSWKFAQKTGLTGTDLRAVIASHPGHDVYYCNPYPEFEALYHNLWLQGETSHPNFLVLCQEFFEVTNIRLENTKAFVPSHLFAASNYFIATPKFWLAYLKFVGDVVAKAEAGMSKTAKAMIYSSAADRIGAHAGASYLPFIIERLFAVFLAANAKTFSAYKYPLPAKEDKLNVHLKLLRQMKDLSLKTKSLWMATCWVNYRNLYMSNNYGAEWCKKYLKNITPTEFKYE